MTKYGNLKVKIDDITFDSRMEADYYIRLKICKSQNKIKSFCVHPKIVLQEKFKYKGKSVSAITYSPDFKVINADETIEYIDIKGVKTNEFKIKEKMFKNLIKDDENTNFYCLTLHNEQWVKV